MTPPAFDDRVAAYAKSPSHRSGESLALVLKLAAIGPGTTALDVSTGTGFTAHALAGAGVRVVASDLAPNMLRHAVAASPLRIQGALSDVQRLAFADDIFGAVTCRHAFHHFVDGAAAVREMARVLRPGGRLVIADTVAPDDSRITAEMHAIELARDRYHVRNRTASELRELLHAAGLRVAETAETRSEQDFDQWCRRTDVTAELVEQLWRRFTVDGRVREAFRVRDDSGVRRFAWPVLVIAARKD